MHCESARARECVCVSDLRRSKARGARAIDAPAHGLHMHATVSRTPRTPVRVTIAALRLSLHCSHGGRFLPLPMCSVLVCMAHSWHCSGTCELNVTRAMACAVPQRVHLRATRSTGAGAVSRRPRTTVPPSLSLRSLQLPAPSRSNVRRSAAPPLASLLCCFDASLDCVSVLATACSCRLSTLSDSRGTSLPWRSKSASSAIMLPTCVLMRVRSGLISSLASRDAGTGGGAGAAVCTQTAQCQSRSTEMRGMCVRAYRHILRQESVDRAHFLFGRRVFLGRHFGQVAARRQAIVIGAAFQQRAWAGHNQAHFAPSLLALGDRLARLLYQSFLLRARAR